MQVYNKPSSNIILNNAEVSNNMNKVIDKLTNETSFFKSISSQTVMLYILRMIPYETNICENKTASRQHS